MIDMLLKSLSAYPAWGVMPKGYDPRAPGTARWVSRRYWALKSCSGHWSTLRAIRIRVRVRSVLFIRVGSCKRGLAVNERALVPLVSDCTGGAGLVV